MWLQELAKLLQTLKQYLTAEDLVLLQYLWLQLQRTAITIESNKVVLNGPAIRGELVIEDSNIMKILRKILAGGGYAQPRAGEVY